MEEVYRLVLARNAIETIPYKSIHSSNDSLQRLVDTYQSRCDKQDKHILELQSAADEEFAAAKEAAMAAVAAAKDNSKLELSKLRDKLEKVQEQLNEKLRIEVDSASEKLQTNKELSKLKDLITMNEKERNNLRDEKIELERTIETLCTSMKTAETTISITERQNASMKDEITRIQDEKMELEKVNDQLLGRIVSEKESMMDQFNKMNDMVEGLQKEVDMLRGLQTQHEKEKQQHMLLNKTSSSLSSPSRVAGDTGCNRRKWGSMRIVPPSEPKQIIKAHSKEIVSVRYDDIEGDLVATASFDSTVKVWDAGTGQARGTLRTNTGQPMMDVDIALLGHHHHHDSNSSVDPRQRRQRQQQQQQHRHQLVAGASCDKTCRVWNLKTERMMHHLVGHSNKVTCVRLRPDGKCVVTGSSDRSIKVWDIARNTYKVKSTMRHGSAINCIDVTSDFTSSSLSSSSSSLGSSDSIMAVSGHFDGGIRFWDIRAGERAEIDMPHLHSTGGIGGAGSGSGGVTSIEFDPSSSARVLTSGHDSTVKIIDVRKVGDTLITLQHKNFVTTSHPPTCCFSPDGSYVAAGSGASNEIFIWRVADGTLEKTVKGANKGGIMGLAWGLGGISGQQVASVDGEGNLVLWA